MIINLVIEKEIVGLNYKTISSFDRKIWHLGWVKPSQL